MAGYKSVRNTGMHKNIYLFSLAVGLVTLIASVVGVINIMSAVDENSGNAGAFGFFISFGLGITSITIMFVSGVIGVSVKYIYQDIMPNKILYKIWWPLLFISPTIIILLGVLWSLVTQ